MGIFGWSYPAGCSGPPEDESDPALDAFWEAAWERPELRRMKQENKVKLIEWMYAQVSEAEARGRQQVLDEIAYADTLRAEHKLAEEWKNNPGEQV